jgi:hypothetical protein
LRARYAAAIAPDQATTANLPRCCDHMSLFEPSEISHRSVVEGPARYSTNSSAGLSR